MANQDIIEHGDPLAVQCGRYFRGFTSWPTDTNAMGLQSDLGFIDQAIPHVLLHIVRSSGETALEYEGILKLRYETRRAVYDRLLIMALVHAIQVITNYLCTLRDTACSCRTREPKGKGARSFSSPFREQFIDELDIDKIRDLGNLNARLWAWIEHVYRIGLHGGLDKKTPLDSWRDDLLHVRPLTPYFANKIDDIFYHRAERVVRKDGTISWDGKMFGYITTLSEKVTLVFNPHTNIAVRVETAF